MKYIYNLLLTFLFIAAGSTHNLYSQASTPPCTGGSTIASSGSYDEQIYNVTFTGDGNSINNTTTAGSATAPVDYTAQSVEMFESSSTMSFSVTIGSSYYNRLQINIDTTGDGQFDTEAFGSSQRFGVITGTISLPSSLSIGSYNIRVSTIETSAAFDPCTVSGYGEIEDYTLSIIAEPN